MLQAMKTHLCQSANGSEIVYDGSASHATTHFEDTPELKPAVIEALAATAVAGETMFFEYDLGRVIGTTDLVKTDEHDEIIYAKRKSRDVYTRFTKSRAPQPCSTVTIFLSRLTEQRYELGSAWVGYLGPSFPGDANETPESRPYWEAHALVWGRQEIQSGTETTVCPW